MTERNITMLGINRNHKVTIQANGYGFAVKIGKKNWVNNLPSKFDIVSELMNLQEVGINIDFAINQYNDEIKTNADPTFEEMI